MKTPSNACGDGIACPIDEVCDGNGGCALQSQVDACKDQTSCGPCNYTDRTGNSIDGACFNGACRPILCGDGIVGCGETCDSGIDNNLCTTCSADCRSDLTCGNGIVDLCKGEQCDMAGSNSDTPNAECRSNCQLPRCGDGIVDNLTLHESCDAGDAMNLDVPNAPCRSDCQLPRCGDGIVDEDRGEVCDDGNNISGDGCSGDCKSTETCGNGIIDFAKGEECDSGGVDTVTCIGSRCKLSSCGDGYANAAAGEQCDSSGVDTAQCVGGTCKLSRCGDGYTNAAAGEQCDSSGADSATCDGATCRTSSCGDGYTNPAAGEQCDSGGVDSATCIGSQCKLSRCGDGYTNMAAGEQCDSSGIDSATCVGLTCKTSTCGDGYTNTAAQEQCDSSGVDSAVCVGSTCKLTFCGDNHVNMAAGEQCDSGAVDTATCLHTCKTSTCGDGYVNAAANEQCDSFGIDSSTCIGAQCKLSSCGDGYTNLAAGEECDSSHVDTASCVGSTCKISRCGDGYTNAAAGEQCDSTGNVDTATCVGLTCKTSRCGDGYTNALANEQCDSGGQDTATCVGSTCKTSTCGDGHVNIAASEQCDVLGGGDSATCVGSTCRFSSCGDGHTNLAGNEQCDSSGVDTATCVGSTCKTSICGDGYRNLAAAEECDDGNGRGRDGCSACKSEDATVLVPGSTPPTRRTTGMAYDAARQRLVMFGGYNGAFLNDTWEWDGAGWTQQFPKTTPGGRSGQGMAYDATRHRVVMFGGQNATGGIADTWEWDGTNWSSITPTGTPPTARTLPAMGYDANRRHVIMYGGLDTVANTGFAETWEWTGTAWNKLVTGGSSPGQRYGGSLAFDSNVAHKYSVMYGGNPDGKTFTFDGVGLNWTLASSAGVDDVNHMAMAFDASRSSVVLWHSGTQTWEWSGSGWNAIASAPSAQREESAMAYDAKRQQLVLFGGVTGAGTQANPFVYYNQTYLRAGTTWSAYSGWVEPSARSWTAMVYDPVRGKTVLYGGSVCQRGRVGWGGNSNTWSGNYHTKPGGHETWEFDGRQWVMTGAELPNGEWLRSDHEMVYDVALRQILLWGGRNETDLYAYDGTSWNGPLNGANGDGNGHLHAVAVYDTAFDQLVTFSGMWSDNQTWQWTNGGGWTASAPPGSPSARGHAAFAYDPIRQRCVLYGGVDTNRSTLGDTWEWNTATGTWMQAFAFGPTSRKGHRLTWDPDAERVLLYGHSTNGVEDLWEYAGSWVTRPLFNPPGERHAAAETYDNARHELLTFAGRDLSTGNVTGATQIVHYRSNTPSEACTSAAIDYDNDGKFGCADDDCWAQCDPLQPSAAAAAAPTKATTRPAGAPFCGDGVCNGLEDCDLCPSDCKTGCPATTCGDFRCANGETAASCPNDCVTCGASSCSF